jgi:hypothetical protein
VGEAGEDTGGLTRELWRLFSKSIQQHLCEGQENCLIFRHDSAKLQDGVFKQVGMLVGVSLVQGASGYPFFAPSTFAYLCGKDPCNIVVDQTEIPNYEVQSTLEKLLFFRSLLLVQMSTN